MVKAPFNLLHSLRATKPAHTVLSILLNPRFQLSLMQMEVIHSADAHDTIPRKSRADTIHERATRGAEVIGHFVPGFDGLRLAEAFQVVSPADVFQVRVGDDEVGCEHGGCDFAAVGAVADERVD